MKKHLFTIFLSLLFLGLQAQSSIFLKYDGINGDVAVTGFRDHVEIYDLSYNVTNNMLSNSTETTAIVSPSSPGLITFYNTINKSTPATSFGFYAAAPIAKIEIKLTRGSGPFLIFCVLTLEDCKIASIQNFGDNQEKIQILATKFRVTYTPYNNIGQAQTPVTRGWDYVTNLQNN
ncbi:type VI secretion system tube protein Hcp [Emticicia sp.]|uniref:type VI secretion system tube protein Hcp n=1 Tax=Emticicia sp. TaxID=1930953 RepID=UPI003751677B